MTTENREDQEYMNTPNNRPIHTEHFNLRQLKLLREAYVHLAATALMEDRVVDSIYMSQKVIQYDSILVSEAPIEKGFDVHNPFSPSAKVVVGATNAPVQIPQPEDEEEDDEFERLLNH